MDEDLTNIINQIVMMNTKEVSQIKTNSTYNVNLADIIKSINIAYHNDWEKQKLEFARNFLARTWAGMPLPVLSLCGRGTQEIRYSKYLSYFLDSSKPHGLGARYLDELLSFMNYKNIDLYKAIVENEKWIGQSGGKSRPVDCYCDIVITCNDHVIFIEQKISSGESLNPNSNTTQLVRYDEAINNNPSLKNKEKICIFLTPTGQEAAGSSPVAPTI